MKVIALFLIIISICVGLAFSSNNTVPQSQESLSVSNSNYKVITYPQYGFSVEIPKRFTSSKLPFIPEQVEGFYDSAEKNNSTYIAVLESEEIIPRKKEANPDGETNNDISAEVGFDGITVNKNGVEIHKLRSVATVGDITVYNLAVDVYYRSQNTDRVISIMMYSEKEFSAHQEEFDTIIDSIKTF